MRTRTAHVGLALAVGLLLAGCGSAGRGEPKAAGVKPSGPAYGTLIGQWLDGQQDQLTSLQALLTDLKTGPHPRACITLQALVEKMRQGKGFPVRADEADAYEGARAWRAGLRHYANAADHCAEGDEVLMNQQIREGRDQMSTVTDIIMAHSE
ncbi:hypothetical protein G4Z16_00450 [Streptomyces bathyalis]|uniref:Lipoprotein n=1 Tax=Streptomyces bathyalis TaxID=2710756 RepID=A0A7T1T2C3_9ACTN|nr:hypothetical protein [Streptomyces bathyalis]QPP05114.1 hypothetical protein G4Z16_00450 [Streptomyces bathyalis]